ncbi:hypothetical protein [Archangium sp.]|uniref:hypothetical protein n=1 Tax=Archangium sp. TaxID=1872627 RepID=UPI00286B1410|nr:hypothetical protein [Archangium sp.]
MKAKILVGAVAALIYGNAALAQDQSTTGSQDQGQQSPDNLGGSGLEDNNASDLIIMDQEEAAPVTPDTGVDQGVGGAGLDEGVGGAGQQSGGINMQGPGGVTLYCTPVQGGATGGSGDISSQPQSSLERDYDDVDVGSVPLSGDDAFGGSGMEDMDKDKESKANMRGLTVLLGAGVEGYTGGLAPQINPGASVGVTAALRPSKTFGLELGYTGAVNNLDRDVAGSGPDIVRNGAQAAVTVGLSAAPVQPYLLGGFGMNWYNVRNGESLGFSDDTNSKVPVGVGLRTHIGSLTADARVNYNFLIADDFAPGVVDTGAANTGSYNGTLNIGGTF